MEDRKGIDTHLKKLDTVLEFLRDNEDGNPDDLEEKYVNQADVSNHLFKEFDYTITLKELARIYAKLRDDKYIWQSGGNLYLTYDGYLFYGYVEQRKQEAQKLIASSNILTQDKTYRRNLLWATWSAGFAAALLLGWQVWIWFYPVHKDYPYWFWQKIQVQKHAKAL